MVEECVIVGGGIAGLSAANRLADKGLSPLLIEANNYPAHRICGEFLSPECLPILHQWDIPAPSLVTKSHLFSGSKNLRFSLPQAASTCSRYIFDSMLSSRAQLKGARVMTNTLVAALQRHTDFYELKLSNGDTLKAKHLILGTGRIPKMEGGNQPSPSKYVGFKAHFQGIENHQSLEMYCFKGGYLGIAPLDAHTSNMAGLFKKEALQETESLSVFISNLLESKELKNRLRPARMVFPQWLTGELPEFGIRNRPLWDRVFWIGDAAGVIPPITGEGLALSVTSGYMAADYLVHSDAKQFQRAWRRRYRNRFFWAGLLHKMMMSPQASSTALVLAKKIPWLASTFWKLTRENVT